MGAQQVLRAAACSALITSTAAAAPSATQRERAALIDLGPPTGGDARVRVKLAAALVDAGLEPVQGDGLEDALAGIDNDRDAIVLAAAMGDAERSFGQLDCVATRAAAERALPVLAARQAGGVAVPELPRAWAYVLLCADREGAVDVAMRAAAMLRVVGGSPNVTPAILSKYPSVDAMLGNDAIDVDVTADVADARLFVDFQPVGTAPAHLALAPGDHIIAAATGSRRGFLTGTVVASQRTLAIALTDQAGPWSAVAAKIASWHGKMPTPEELGWVLETIHARAALIRHGDIVEVWGHAGRVETPRRLGGDDGVRSIAEADRAAALIADRVAGWSSHAPDPDQPLLTEDIHDRAKHFANGENEPTKWWVYATIGAAVLAGVTIVYLHHAESTTEHLELHYP